MSANPFSLTSGGGSGGGGGAEQDPDRDEQRDKTDDSGTDTIVGTKGTIRATTENVQGGLSAQTQMGDPTTTDVSLGSGGTVTVDETSGQGATEGRMTITNQSEGGTTVSVDRGPEQAATTVKKKGKPDSAVRVDQLDTVKQQSQSAPTSPRDPFEDTGSKSNSGGGPSPSGDPMGAVRSGMAGLFPGGGSASGPGLFSPSGGSGGGLMDTLTSPAGLVLAALAVGAVVLSQNDGNGQNGGQSDG
jgi:hypothetical protein